MARYNTIGKNYKTVTCAQTGEEVTRRKSLAVDYQGDGKGGSPAAPCKRVKRELAPKPVALVIAEAKKAIAKAVKHKLFEPNKVKVATKKVTKPLSTKEKVQIKKILAKKRDEAKEPS